MPGKIRATRATRAPVALRKGALLAVLISLFSIHQLMTQPGSHAAGARKTGAKKPRIAAGACSFQGRPESAPESVNDAMFAHRRSVSRETSEVAKSLAIQSAISLAPPQEIPRKNFIDALIFDRMARDNVMSAPLCTDLEFVRRVYLDLSGRIPSPEETTGFLNDASPNKRDALIDRLIGTPEFVDKWTMFFGDLFKNNARSVNVVRYTGGRDALYRYLKDAITVNKSYAQMATEMIGASGDSFDRGEVNYVVGGIVPMGPAQDTMDGSAVNAASMFLGINAVDCLLCHNGAGHLDQVNLWGKQRLRAEAWGMSAFFARTRIQREYISRNPNYAKYQVSELASGEYRLNTDYGNRTTRAPIETGNTVAPSYILGGGGVRQGETRRQALARHITSDIQFSRAAVNYLWEKLMVEALVSPSNTFDPDRLDPNAQLPDGWSLQPANPELLAALAQEFKAQNYDLRAMIALITKSSAYQLSSQYPGQWSLALVPYYARKYVRRLDAEEIHDAVLKATGVPVVYQLTDNLGNNTFSVNWAMQLPDPSEPRGSGVLQFLNAFIRGDRDVKSRSQEPSIQQALQLMNNSFVLSRIHQRNDGSKVAELLGNASLTPEQILNALFLSSLSRPPTGSELESLTPLYASMGRRAATESTQWALLNKVDFIFNY
jgi:hypothetical protein